jgi:hypothetical protein
MEINRSFASSLPCSQREHVKTHFNQNCPFGFQRFNFQNFSSCLSVGTHAIGI